MIADNLLDSKKTMKKTIKSNVRKEFNKKKRKELEVKKNKNQKTKVLTDTEKLNAVIVYIEHKDYIRYINKNIKYCDDSTVLFMRNIKKRQELSLSLTEEQCRFLEMKTDEILLKKDPVCFRSDFLESFL
jgi:hypothetical protein